MKDRETPYSADEQRVSDYIQQITGGAVGSGDDPIGFILASHAELRQKRVTEVPGYMQDGPITPQQINSLVSAIWQVTHSDISREEMLSELSFLSGITVAFLRFFARYLEKNPEAGER